MWAGGERKDFGHSSLQLFMININRTDKDIQICKDVLYGTLELAGSNGV